MNLSNSSTDNLKWYQQDNIGNLIQIHNADLPAGPVVEFEIEELTKDECLKRAAKHLRDATAYLFLAGHHV